MSSNIWAKSGYREGFYNTLGFTQSYAGNSEYTQVESSHREVSAKSHALRAYWTARTETEREYLRDADLINQTEASLLGMGILQSEKVRQPRILYQPTDSQEICVIIHQFSDYFPGIGYMSKGEKSNEVECPCTLRQIAGRCCTKIRGLPPGALVDDPCGEESDTRTLAELMTHLHQRNTPIHSAAFAYLAFTSGDRLPDFGYVFGQHSDFGLDVAIGLTWESGHFRDFVTRYEENEKRNAQTEKVFSHVNYNSDLGKPTAFGDVATLSRNHIAQNEVVANRQTRPPGRRVSEGEDLGNSLNSHHDCPRVSWGGSVPSGFVPGNKATARHIDGSILVAVDAYRRQAGRLGAKPPTAFAPS
jgi:hypothetical protein